jgi:uncharacterized protein (DUF2236 family)
VSPPFSYLEAWTIARQCAHIRRVMRCFTYVSATTYGADAMVWRRRVEVHYSESRRR